MQSIKTSNFYFSNNSAKTAAATAPALLLPPFYSSLDFVQDYLGKPEPER